MATKTGKTKVLKTYAKVSDLSPKKPVKGGKVNFQDFHF